jgi:hypothetical protein
MSVPVHTIHKKQLSDILTRWYDISEIPKYDNVKTRLSKTTDVVVTEQNLEEISKTVFSENVLRVK